MTWAPSSVSELTLLEKPGIFRNGDASSERFRAFHAANPDVYVALCTMARRLRRRGHSKYSIKGLFEVLRFQMATMETTDSDFRLNNNFTAYYARMIMAREADLRGFFTLREQRIPFAVDH